MMLSTREAREILNRSIDLSDVIWQSANLAGFLTGCFTGDLQLIRESLEDVIIEPQRKVLIPGFQAVKEGAMAQRRARVLDLGRRADGVRLVRGTAMPSAFAMRWSAGFARTASTAMPGSRRSIRPARASSTDRRSLGRPPCTTSAPATPTTP